MNFKRHAQKLETFLNDEFAKNLPVVQLPNGTVVYNHFKVKKNKANVWALQKTNLASPIDVFNLKVCALLAAKFYEKNNINKLNEIKRLDQLYQQNLNDSIIFKHRFKTSKDAVRRDIALWRWELTHARAKDTKNKIANMFRLTF
jgi:hypothetical protein